MNDFNQPSAHLQNMQSREHGNSPRHFAKADITVEDQLKYRCHLLVANRRTFVGFSKENLDIIAISFEHLCFSESENRKEYKAKIRKKLKEWNYDDFSEDDEVDSSVQAGDYNPDRMEEIPEVNTEILSTPSSSFVAMPSSSQNPTPKSGGSSKGSTKLGSVRSPSRARGASPTQQVLPTFTLSPSLFDPTFLDKINLNDPAKRALWVEAVWRYFNNGGRPPSDMSGVRGSSFATAPSPSSPITPTVPHFQPMTIQYHPQGIGGYEHMDGLETYSQEAQAAQGGDNSAQMVNFGPLSPRSLSYVHEQWRDIQGHDIA